MRTHHSQFPGPLRSERQRRRACGCGPATRCARSACCSRPPAILVALGGLVQVNPIWQWGPYEPYYGTNGAQPDWYLGWLIGALRLMPPLEIVIAGKTVVPNPFFGGVLFPTAVFGVPVRLAVARAAPRRDGPPPARPPARQPAPHGDRRGGVHLRVVVFLAGSADRLFLSSGVAYQTQVWLFRIAVIVVPPLVYVLAGASAASCATAFDPRRLGEALICAVSGLTAHRWYDCTPG